MTLEQLLVVQEHDSAIDRLVYKRANLPEHAALVELDDEQAFLDAERATLADKRHEIAREQGRFEDDAATITNRIDLENERLYSGAVTAHKDLQALQAELKVLTARRSAIEDEILGTMELGEPIDAALAEMDAKLENVAQRRVAAQDSLAASELAIDEEVESERTQRTEAALPIDPALLVSYETTRADCGGVGVCRLAGKTCQGCHMHLAAVELDRIRKESDDALIRCGECSRILVR